MRQREVDFPDSCARVDGGQCSLVGVRLAPYRIAHVQLPDPARRRRLMLKERDIARVIKIARRRSYAT